MGDKYKQNSSLTFHYTFEYDSDIVFFAHFVPYTYSDLTTYLRNIQENEKLKDRVKIDALCRSLCGNLCYSLTITNDISLTYYSSKEEIEAFKIFEYFKGKNPNALTKEKKNKRKRKDKDSNGLSKGKKKSGSLKKINIDGNPENDNVNQLTR